MADEESGFGGCEVGGGDDEVAFVLAVFGVEDDDGVAAGWERVLDLAGYWLLGVCAWGFGRSLRRTVSFNGFGDGVEGWLQGAVWLLVGRHCD